MSAAGQPTDPTDLTKPLAGQQPSSSGPDGTAGAHGAGSDHTAAGAHGAGSTKGGGGGTGPLLTVSNLRKSYGDHVPLRDISLTAAEHECIVLIGASGSGKSTLLRCINLLEVVDDGVITLDGTDITDPRVNADRVRSDVGMVFQSYNLFPHMSVLDNIMLAPRKVRGVGKATARADAMAMLERVGLANKAKARPDQLSGGQQQRVAIARALVNKPRLMLFDEVTSALDPELVGEVLALLTELKTEGMTMLVATHEMSFARDVADRVLFLADGQVAESGPPEQVLAAPQDPRTQRFLRRMLG
ncbi:ATP-binding cassette domain-containing protein [Nakamurella aerolata]|uniref:ABC-type polar-amino-acid transporter n=1 Tax=Nakamurella aerolata TaxID=1656892 RepID=A0A849AHM3_9ACTN|nr:amino acid ABC transporter ATP-binding protein [Nakamurella aerolata]